MFNAVVSQTRKPQRPSRQPSEYFMLTFHRLKVKWIRVTKQLLHQLEKRYVFRIYIYMLVQLVNIDKKTHHDDDPLSGVPSTIVDTWSDFTHHWNPRNILKSCGLLSFAPWKWPHMEVSENRVHCISHSCPLWREHDDRKWKFVRAPY